MKYLVKRALSICRREVSYIIWVKARILVKVYVMFVESQYVNVNQRQNNHIFVNRPPVI